ncbi:MAG: tRNA (N6-isopentenyl adenosine(37)-C2)-methylthiotransferase MiaB [Elusimicrobiota bacterium]
MPKVYIKTFGCQMNVYDSELIEQGLESKGYFLAKNREEADLLIVNTCAVRGHAEERALSAIGELKKLKQKNPNIIIVLAGCLAQHHQKKIFKRFAQIDLVLGTDQVADLPSLLDGFLANRRKTAAVGRKRVSARLKGRGVKHSFVTIIRGCDNACAYCIVPSVRGPAVSRPKEEILAEIEGLAASGTKEITLLGQNVNAYRQDGSGFSSLLSRIEQIAGIEKIGFVTNHPKDMIREIIETISGMKKFSGSLHLPVQSGSDRVLEKMNRGYTRKHYLQLIKNIRQFLPNCRITTDIIVGFPGETEADFKQTLSLVEEIKFAAAYTFKYSLRPGTVSSRLENNIPLEVKKERLAALNKKLKEISAQICD